MKRGELTLEELFDNPTNPWILDDKGLDPEEEPEVWWARPLTPDDWDQIARNRKS
jgi:hypothetical protein